MRREGYDKSFCASVSVSTYSRTTGTKPAHERYQPALAQKALGIEKPVSSRTTLHDPIINSAHAYLYTCDAAREMAA